MTAVRLLRVPLAADCPPEAALRALADDPWPFALSGRWAGGGAIVGSDPLRLAAPDDDPFALLDELPAVAPPAEGPPRSGAPGPSIPTGRAPDAPAAAGHPPDAVGGGWFGWLGHGLGARVERLAPPPPRPAPLPPFQLAYYDHVLRRDRAGRWWFEALATAAREPALARRLDLLRTRLAAAATLPPPRFAPPARPFRIAGGGARAHVAAVAECVERIAAGEIFQANVCLRFESDWEGAIADLFARAAPRLRPAYAAAFPAPWGGVASLSPELFLRRRGRAVETGPIKGTIARDGDGDDPAAAAARAALTASAKDRAEHVMIVDLMRNDLGRVCAYGSIEAAPTPAAEPHPGLWHLVSRVRGTLRPDVGDGELLRATFPPGSVTGAPKVQALHVIGELEGSGRELYTGAVGYASPLAGLELNVAIRTFEARDGRLWLGAGGGVVADSDPSAELEECHVKARPLVAAIDGRLPPPPAPPAPAAPSPPPAAAPPAPAAPAPSRRATASPIPRALSRGRRRPDPGRGLFETLRVEAGEPLRAAAHLARLERSAAALFDLPLPADLAEQVAGAAARTAAAQTAPAEAAPADAAPAAARLRVSAVPAGDRLAVTIAGGALPARPLPIALAPVVLPGGLGAHKWLDRDLLDALAADGIVPPAATALLLDGDGALLEAAWGSLFALERERLVTPPADGRILPGVTRAALIAAARADGVEVVEEPIDLARAAAADGLLVSSALALALPARLATAPAGARESAAGPLAARLRALLRGRVEATA